MNWTVAFCCVVKILNFLAQMWIVCIKIKWNNKKWLHFYAKCFIVFCMVEVFYIDKQDALVSIDGASNIL